MSDTRKIFRCPQCGGMSRVPVERLAQEPKCGRCKEPLDPSAHPAEVSDDDLEKLIRGAPVPVLVDFWAPWCGLCRMVAPHLDELAAPHAGDLIVVKVNTDVHQRTASLRIQSIPTLVL